MNDNRAQFAGQKYLNLESYRASGQGVCTPLWFAEHDAVFYFYTVADSHKVKRLRHNPKVRIAPCDARGNLKGEWVQATARHLEGAEAHQADEWLNLKYGWLKRVINYVGRLRGHQRVAFAVRPD